MKISLNFLIKDLDGKPIEDVNAGKLVAQLLATSTENDAIKLMAWALSFHSGNDVELDKSDFSKLKEIITSSKSLTNLVKAQILEVLIEYKQYGI
jgi:cell division septal protein FtsQ